MIAEVKRASPSKGDIRPNLDVAAVVSAYEQAGARAISILTEERHFKGSLMDLRQARQASGLPLLRKDFIIDPYQVWEAAEAGADAILLIVAALKLKQLKELYDEATAAGLECLFEVHKRDELKTALAAGAALVGINNRDLKTFKVNLETTLNLIEFVPKMVPVVSESGIKSSNDVARLAQAGVAAILVGEVLMLSQDPGEKVRELQRLDYTQSLFQ
jgi:indole-3-glycerol phosphate synthase